MSWEVVIGLEVHTQLNTRSKIFSGASTQFGAEPNTQACAVDLGLPGVLPVLNKEALNKAVLFGLAIGAHINKQSVFARKNYFYADLPKGYQISQHDLPIVGQGELVITLSDGVKKTVGITRAHLEEDAGKSVHEDLNGKTGVDLNRAGTPLLEIVSEPDMRSSEEAVAYAKSLHSLVRYIGICDGNMQEGSFRMDANVSVRRPGEPLGTRCEIKNLNSFRFLEQAIEYEVERQIELIEQGGEVRQETRLFNVEKGETRAMRSKEDAHDYRYFPDPDLVPVVIEDDYLAAMKAKLPELPEVKRDRYIKDYGLSEYDATLVTQDMGLVTYFEACVKSTQAAPKIVANWLLGELSGALNKAGFSFEQSPVSPEALAGLLDRITDNTISGKIAKQVFEAMWAGEGRADDIIEAQGLRQVTDTGAIEAMIDEVLAQSAAQVADYKAGKDKMMGYFVGQVMKLSQGKANPQAINAILKDKLK
ncbi:MAG: Asp-tRNA(Asn)/Glu-tRNA(Gln) amidotransferase GatCAB subunit B [Gammaproteobacteria bacterium CG11_big_fil_rev_8_21_14_0_20_46_22]|nr:MAG: Asp-tRNA(Asn)/Glu-tRNA(Gln) amidotransferase GatCAB subunit B [Gammaproteobacteria bacterium CG12_big_fil_rev_8_21_14_0_65_46_12]PIR11480.1 MAG: Asp-tRNA(Asn)/Glu-tRNA(Gln) amidotransferase GatCAB subunit B [Gammaproteobacteria bacterium CG11_big_fil_rev_8_21_14_0_20_46_22]